MFGYLLFGLTIIVYIVLILHALEPQGTGGDAAYGSAIVALFSIKAFGLCRLFLTIYISVQGGFDWIS